MHQRCILEVVQRRHDSVLCLTFEDEQRFRALTAEANCLNLMRLSINQPIKQLLESVRFKNKAQEKKARKQKREHDRKRSIRRFVMQSLITFRLWHITRPLVIWKKVEINLSKIHGMLFYSLQIIFSGKKMNTIQKLCYFDFVFVNCLI